MKIGLATLGCKTNHSDAASLAAELSAQGHTLIPFHQLADVYIVHTCTVTQETEYQSRQLIRRAIARNPRAQIIVTGCYAQVDPETLRTIPGVDFIVGIRERQKIPEIIASEKKFKEACIFSSSVGERLSLEDGRLPLFSERTRAYLKVQDGCNAFCSYCIVPYARGRSRSLPLQDALAKAKELAGKGFKEIVLTGIHLGAYGEDLNPSLALLDLLQALEGETPDIRIRLSSIEPKEFAPSLIDFLAQSLPISIVNVDHHRRYALWPIPDYDRYVTKYYCSNYITLCIRLVHYCSDNDFPPHFGLYLGYRIHHPYHFANHIPHNCEAGV